MQFGLYGPLALAIVALSGCYRVVPLTSPTPRPGQRVIVSLSNPIEFQVVEARLQNIRRLEGTVVGTNPDSLVVSAAALWSGAETRHSALGALVTVPMADVREVQEKRPALGRSLLLAVGSVGAVIAGFTLVKAIGGGGGGGDPPRRQ